MKNEITINEAVISVKVKKEYYDSLNDDDIEVLADKIDMGLERLCTPDLVRQALEGQGLDLNNLIIRIDS